MNDEQDDETPANKIATAQAVLSLAFRLGAEVHSGRITRTIFEHEVSVVTGNKGIVVPAFPEATDQDLLAGIENIFLIALSASALTLDETLNEFYGPLSEEADNNRKGYRVMVNQLRNAFAHNPWRPRWIVFPKYRNQYPIQLNDGSTFIFNSCDLNGNGIKPEDVGGMEFWVKLLQHCERAVESEVR